MIKKRSQKKYPEVFEKYPDPIDIEDVAKKETQKKLERRDQMMNLGYIPNGPDLDTMIRPVTGVVVDLQGQPVQVNGRIKTVPLPPELLGEYAATAALAANEKLAACSACPEGRSRRCCERRRKQDDEDGSRDGVTTRERPIWSAREDR